MRQHEDAHAKYGEDKGSKGGKGSKGVSGKDDKDGKDGKGWHQAPGSTNIL